MRTYSETLEFLFSRLPMFSRIGGAAFKKDLTNTLALCAELGNPEKKFKSIHIAGTNGKGSSSHMLASIFQSQGFKTGLYTSPHLRNFRERIRINGEMIGEEEVIQFTDRMEASIQRIQPSFFELGVAMAFEHFAKNQVDIAIIETGMGGRLDSTNVILPELSLITNIGMDHTEFLGKTLPAIAVEKAGIIKPKIPAIISKTQAETTSVFQLKAQEMGSPLYFADQLWEINQTARNNDYQTFAVKRKGFQEAFEVHLDLTGTYQRYNLPGILEVLHQLKGSAWECEPASIFKGLSHVKSQTGLLGRWQLLGKSPKIICDTGHNEDGIKEVVAMLQQEHFSRLHVVIGMVNDKDIDTILSLLPKTAIYYFTQAAIPRAMPAEELKAKAHRFGLFGNHYPTVASAYETAKQAAADADLIFVGGSTFVVAEVV